MELEVYSKEGEKTGRTVQLNKDVFGIEPNDHVIWLDVKRIRNAARQGTHKTKDRSEMSYSTKKLFKQKGTGGARRGDRNSGVLYHGARIHGPRPRNYDIKLNKKVRSLARKSALSYKIKEQAIIVVENFDYETPKTKQFLALLKALNTDTKKNLLVLDEPRVNTFLSARNLPNVAITQSTNVNTYDVLNANHLIIMEGAFEKLNSILS